MNKELWKNKVIETKLRHQNMSCKTFTLKLDTSHLSIQKIEYLYSLFLEAKWLYNTILSSANIIKFDTKPDYAYILKDKQYEIRHINNLSSQMKQAVKQRIINSMKALKVRRNNKKKVKNGKIKFTSQVKSITLNQYGITYSFINQKYLKLQGSKYLFKINGLKQIPKDVEITSATISTRHKDFYLKITCFVPKDNKEFKNENKVVGIDFGLKDSITQDNGSHYNIHLSEHQRLKRSRRQLSRRAKNSFNYIKMKDIVNKECHKLTNKKQDKKNKIVHEITKDFGIVIVQNENIKVWHTIFGKSIQSSLLGGIMSDLSKKSHTFIKVDRFFPSTQLCSKCGNKQNMGLKDRTYCCKKCGLIIDRDVNSAINIKNEGLKQIPTGRRESTLMEILPLHNHLVDYASEVNEIRSFCL